MYHYLSPTEIEEIIKLYEEGWSQKNLAVRYNVCEATISNHVTGRHKPRFRKKTGRPKGVKIAKPYARPEFVEQDFSQLPDSVLFEHVRECNFIG
jgi:Helix-turn-helix domain